MTPSKRRSRFLLWFLPLLALSALMILGAPSVAHAAESCGPTTCYATETFTWTSPSYYAPSGGGGAGGGGVSPYYSTYTACTSWSPAYGFGTGVSQYPFGEALACGSWGGGTFEGGTSWGRCLANGTVAPLGQWFTYLRATPPETEDELVRVSCAYPMEATPTVTTVLLYRGANLTFGQTYSYSTAAAGSFTTQTDSTSFLTGLGKGQTPAQCMAAAGTDNCSTLSLTWTAAVRQNLWGFYTMRAVANTEQWRRTSFPAWSGRAAEFTRLSGGTAVQTRPYTYSCDLSPALQSGLNTGVPLSLAGCAQSRIDRGEVRFVGGSVVINNNPADQTVLRNGNELPLTINNPAVQGAVRNVGQWTNNIRVHDTCGLGEDEFEIVPRGGVRFFWTCTGSSRFQLANASSVRAEIAVNVTNGIGQPTSTIWVPATLTPPDQFSNRITVVRSVVSP